MVGSTQGRDMFWILFMMLTLTQQLQIPHISQHSTFQFLFQLQMRKVNVSLMYDLNVKPVVS